VEATNWTEEEARCFLEGMRTVSTLRGTRPLGALESEMLESVARHVLHTDLDISRLQECAPADFARKIQDPRRRTEFVQFLVLLPYLDMQVDAGQVAIVDEIAAALDIETQTLKDLHRVRDDRLKRLLLDYGRRSFSEYAGAEGVWQELKAVTETVRQFIGDSSVADRYRALENYPGGSLGRVFFQFYRERSFPLPGEKKSFSELLVPHDCCHILGGFNTDMNGEMDVAGFEAGLFESGFGFELLLEVILDFHLGKTFTTAGLLPPGTGHFDPEGVLVGYERGAACTVNLIGDWDFWGVADQSVAGLRKRYGIPEIPGPVLLSPPATMDAPPRHEHENET